jgi:type II secretory pathway component PulK
MDTRLYRQTGGSALISAAVAAGVLTILVAGYVSYMANEYLLNFHSHAWTQALHLSEAAIETAFAEFNYQYFQGGSGFQSSRGWSGSG